MARPDELRLGEVLTSLAVVLVNDAGLKADLERLARVACGLIGHCDAVSVSMLIDGAPTTVASPHRVALQLDLIQYDAGEGPCIAALGGQVVRIANLDVDQQFPHFARGAADTRVQSVLSTPAVAQGDVVVGSLNVYSRRADAFDDRDHDVALLMAAEIAHALARSAVLSTARSTRDRLQEEYDERTLVAQAKGVLAALQDCGLAQAGVLIERAAARNGGDLRATAERILAAVRDGEVAPAAEPDRPA